MRRAAKTTLIPVSSAELAHLLLSSFRYSLGRASYITAICADTLTRHWAVLPERWQRQIQNDIQKAIGRGHGGHECDVEQWERILALPIKAD